jgi:hypothetical protein
VSERDSSDRATQGSRGCCSWSCHPDGQAPAESAGPATRPRRTCCTSR